MELYFLRHGIAEDNAPDGTDFGRRLTPEGIAKLENSRAGLKRLELRLDALLTSPLVRAYQTAEIVGRLLDIGHVVAEELAPGCDVERLLGLLASLPNAQRVMVVGHEPDFSELIGVLTGGSRVVVKKGGLARIDLPAGAHHGELVWLLPPRALR
jgi:phosphohistidine phosphatase